MVRSNLISDEHLYEFCWIIDKNFDPEEDEPSTKIILDELMYDFDDWMFVITVKDQ